MQIADGQRPKKLLMRPADLGSHLETDHLETDHLETDHLETDTALWAAFTIGCVGDKRTCFF